MPYRNRLSHGLARAHLLDNVLYAVAVAIRFVPGIADFSYIVVAILALRGNRAVVISLLMSWLFTMVNPGLAPEAPLGGVGRYAVIALAFASMLARGNFGNNCAPIVPTLVLALFLVIHSTFVSPILDVSMLKVISWTVAMATVLSAWAAMSQYEREVTERDTFSILVAVMLLSLPLLMSPLGYLRNGRGFQGILNHPQAMGPTMALLAAWLVSQIFGKKTPPWSAVGLAGICLSLIVLSQARTAGLALLFGLVGSIVTAVVLSGGRLFVALPGLRSPRIIVLSVVSIVAMTVLGSYLEDTARNYISKGTSNSNIGDAFGESRMGLISPMIANISANPWWGIGFGIASVPEAMVVTRDPILGLPVGAAVEKGVMPVAVLEELGIIGASAVVLWMTLIVVQSARRGVVHLSVIMTILLLNLGENTFFSAGGFGMLAMILLGWSVTGHRTTRVQSSFPMRGHV